LAKPVLLTALLLCSVGARAELEIQVTQGLKNATPIAIVPFSTSTSAGSAKAGTKAAESGQTLPADVSTVVSEDLYRSGMFKPLAASDLLSRPTTQEQIIYRDFRVLGVPYLVVGQVSGNAESGFRIHYGLYDTNRQKQLVSQTYTATASQLRDVAHAIADKIFEQLTGVPGVFSTKILYVTNNRGDAYPYQLQYADSDGARAQTVLRSKQPIMSPSWSPDGKEIAYVSFEDDGLPAIYIHTLATGKRRVVSEMPGINGAPAFSPDGTKLALTLSKDGNAEIYVMDIATGALTRETNNPAIDTEPCWMPDGKSLLFTSSRGGGPQIYRFDLASKSVSRITFDGDYNAKPSITPDGRFLVYVHRKDGQYHIAVQDLQRGTFHIVTQTELDESPSVAPNGSMVLYGSLSKGKNVLEEVSIDGRVKIRLPSKAGDVSDPAWSPYL
jgi:TolB protein